MDKYLRASLMMAALLAGAGVFYHYVIFLPNVEQAKREQAETDRRAAATREAQRYAAYEECKFIARRNYDQNWATACEAVAKQRQESYQNCLQDRVVMTNPYLGKPHCDSTYGGSDPKPDCSLPSARAASINTLLKDAEEKCLAEAKSGLSETSLVK